MAYTGKVYHFWYERNSDGSKGYVKLPAIIKKSVQINGTSITKQQIGGDSFLDNDEQEAEDYE